jgi:mRNA-degrading endonuclease RelE of RelBE toxin-antitoxin system
MRLNSAPPNPAFRASSTRLSHHFEVFRSLETHLRFAPTKISKSRIKRLRGLIRPQFRLRMDDIRVFYDVTDKEVQVLVIVSNDEAQAWLDAEGEAEP